MSTETGAQKTGRTKRNKVKIFGREYQTNEVLIGLLFILPTIGFMVFTFIIPVIDVVELSFTNFNLKTRTMEFIKFDNYTKLLGTEDFWKSLLNTVKYSTNPYNVNRMTAAAGVGALSDEEYTRRNCSTIISNRLYLTEELSTMGFTVLPSSTNFVFVAHPHVSGQEVYEKLRERGVLVRHFKLDRIKDYNRITVGTREQMDILLSALRSILGGKE